MIGGCLLAEFSQSQCCASWDATTFGRLPFAAGWVRRTGSFGSSVEAAVRFEVWTLETVTRPAEVSDRRLESRLCLKEQSRLQRSGDVGGEAEN